MKGEEILISPHGRAGWIQERSANRGRYDYSAQPLPRQNYAIQRSTNLGASNWVAVLSTNAPCDTVLIQDPQATNNARFDRAVVVP